MPKPRATLRGVGISLHPRKSEARQMASALIRWLEERSIRPVLGPEAAQMLARPDLALPLGQWEGQAQVLVSLGGDGTLLEAVHSPAGLSVPILGVNVGRLGFLTEVEAPDLFWAMDRLRAQDYQLERRHLLEASVVREGKRIRRVLALNDVVVSRGATARMLELTPFIGEEAVGAYRADGLIVATATGSTAYSLSAGGPIVHPGLDVLILTPICAHSLQQSRSIVISPSETIRISVAAEHHEVVLSPDGRAGMNILPGDEILIQRSRRTARFVRFRGRSFYTVLRYRLSDEERPSPHFRSLAGTRGGQDESPAPQEPGGPAEQRAAGGHAAVRKRGR